MCFVYFSTFFPDLLDIVKPRLKNPPDHLFLRWHHQPITEYKVMCLTIHCQLLHTLAHNRIAYYLLSILPPVLSNANSDCTLCQKCSSSAYMKAMVRASVCGEWRWMARHMVYAACFWFYHVCNCMICTHFLSPKAYYDTMLYFSSASILNKLSCLRSDINIRYTCVLLMEFCPTLKIK